MPQGGDLCIQAENVYLSDHYCKPFEVPGGNYVKVSVTDTGVGIDEEIIERIFNIVQLSQKIREVLDTSIKMYEVSQMKNA